MNKLILEELEYNTQRDYSLLDCDIAQYNGRLETKKFIYDKLQELFKEEWSIPLDEILEFVSNLDIKGEEE